MGNGYPYAVETADAVAVITMQDRERFYRLLQEFADHKWNPTPDELDRILGNQKENYTSYVKKKFVKNFFIQFSDDFETQFLRLLELIRNSFSLGTEGYGFFVSFYLPLQTTRYLN